MMTQKNKIEPLTPAMKVWMLKTFKLGTISTETLKEFVSLCEIVQIELTPEERRARIEFLKAKLFTD